jgi:hypothetical protein
MRDMIKMFLNKDPKKRVKDFEKIKSNKLFKKMN